MAVCSQGAPLSSWQVLYLILLGVHERELRKKKKELEVLLHHGFSACFVLVLCSHGVTVDASPFCLWTLIICLLMKNNEGGSGGVTFIFCSFISFVVSAGCIIAASVAVPLM